MRWQDEAVIIATRLHGEASVIVEVMTKRHGRHLGMVRGGKSRTQRAILQPGNMVEAEWSARLDEHLGMFKFEVKEYSCARLLEVPLALQGFQLVAAHLHLLPERDPHLGLYETLLLIIAHYDDYQSLAELMARFEVHLLEELGFGLDLSRCGATSEVRELVYVSPKSGRAISKHAGAPWHDKLLALPQFLLSTKLRADNWHDIDNAFKLTGFFLERYVWQPRGLKPPAARTMFIKMLDQQFNANP